MHRVVAILLLFTIHIQPISNGVIVLDFILNQEYVKEFLCINKEQPELQCNGKCHLSKQLENNTPNKEQQLSLLFDYKHYFNSAWASILPIQYMDYEFKSKLPKYSMTYYKDIVFDIFHPPKRATLPYSFKLV